MTCLLALLSVAGSTVVTWLGFNKVGPAEWLVFSPGLLFGALVLAPIARRSSSAIWRPILLTVLSSLLYFGSVHGVANTVTSRVVPVAALVSSLATGVLLASTAWLRRWRARATWAAAAVLAALVGGALLGKGLLEPSHTLHLGLPATAWVFAGFAIVQIPLAGILQLGATRGRLSPRSRDVDLDP